MTQQLLIMSNNKEDSHAFKLAQRYREATEDVIEALNAQEQAAMMPLPSWSGGRGFDVDDF